MVMVTLWPGRSTQPVRAIGWLASGEAATQIVCLTLFTKITWREPFATALPACACVPTAGCTSATGTRPGPAPTLALALAPALAAPPASSAMAGTMAATAPARRDRDFLIRTIRYVPVQLRRPARAGRECAAPA